MVCWMTDERALSRGRKLRDQAHHPHRRGRWSRTLHYRLDVNTLHRDESADRARLNEIGRVTLRTTVPLLLDEYRRNRHRVASS